MLKLDKTAEKRGTKKTKRDGALRFAALFRSGAILQRDMPLPIWGTAAPGSRVRCTLGRDSAVTVADDRGDFMLRLPPQSAGRGRKLVLEDLTTGRRTVSRDIAIGEIYLAAGQSNMEFPVGRAAEAEAAMISPDDPDLRMFRIPVSTCPGLRREISGKWQSATAESIAGFSAVAYYFARTLRRELDVPVGIVGAYMGGVGAETFVSREALMTDPDFAADTERYDFAEFAPQLYRDLPLTRDLPNGSERLFERLDELFPDEPEPLGERRGWHLPDHPDADWQEMDLPDSWTLAGHNHAGVFWFRKTVDLPDAWAGKPLELGIGAADKSDETFFNGVRVGATGSFRRFDHWNTPRVYAVPGKLVRPGRNVIAVRVASAASICADGGLIGPSEAMFLKSGKKRMTLTGRWKLRMEHDFGTIGMEFMRMQGPGSTTSLHILYDNMIHPLIPAALRGALWYQGEANAICMAGSYRRLLETLIADWKYRWGQREFDFIVIQLPGFQRERAYDESSQWARLREAQRLAAIHSGSSLAVTLEFGDVYELHAPLKRPVGERCGLIAARKIAGRPPYQAPAPTKCRREGETLIVEFDGPLQLLRGDRVETAMLAGADGVFHPAQADIGFGGRLLRLASATVIAPERVRYAWSNNPVMANLGGGEGLPVSPFELSVNDRFQS